MASRKEARHALAAALEADGIPVRPPGAATPYVALFAAPGDPSLIVHGRVLAGIRIVAVGGAWDAGASADAVDDLTSSILATVRGLDGWQLGTTGGHVIVPTAGGRMLTQETIVSSLVDV